MGRFALPTIPIIVFGVIEPIMLQVTLSIPTPPPPHPRTAP